MFFSVCFAAVPLPVLHLAYIPVHFFLLHLVASCTIGYGLAAVPLPVLHLAYMPVYFFLLHLVASCTIGYDCIGSLAPK